MTIAALAPAADVARATADGASSSEAEAPVAAGSGPTVPAAPATPAPRPSGAPWLRAAVGTAGLALALVGGGFALASAGSGGDGPDGTGPLGPGDVTIELGIHHSRFDAEEIVVVAGTTVEFVLENDDPILHELIVGPPEVHARHAEGTEAAHPPRPGEVTVQPLGVAATTYTFDEPGAFEFACHLPRHRAYGMTGQVVVVDP